MPINPRWFISLVGVCLVGTMAITPLAIAAFEPLSANDVELALAELPGWQSDGVSLTCTYRFDTFVQAIAFVNQLVEPAERIGHHPDLTISYNVVNIALTTHDANGLTTLDTQLAKELVQISRAQGLSACIAPGE
jgi:4a-hydroxytetrahydrobiopterin dehydratase